MRDVGVICTVARNGEGYSIQNVRRYDVWGGVRSDSGASSSASGGHLANTDKRYCANLGHPSDIETGLISMRPRYDEPTSGRFISEDPEMDGKNWYIYCGNEPISRADRSGKKFGAVDGIAIGVFLHFMISFFKGDDESLQSFLRHGLAGAFAAALAKFGETSCKVGEDFISRFITRHNDLGLPMREAPWIKDQHNPRLYQVSFYVGYGLFLAVIASWLETWADGG